MKCRLGTLGFAILSGTLSCTLPALAGEPPPGWNQDIPTGPSNVEGVAVSGRLDAVSVADVIQAIKAFKGIHVEVSQLTVVGKDEAHAYELNRDLGWFTAKRMTCVWVDRSEHPCWVASGQGLPEFKEALQCIKAAQQVYVFPVATPLEPHRDDPHMRLLDGEASNQLIGLLAPPESWLVGLNDLMYPPNEKKNVGFVFRDGKDEVVLFVKHSDVLVGTFNGEHFSGTLNLDSNGKLRQELKEWIAKYAQLELGNKQM